MKIQLWMMACYQDAFGENAMTVALKGWLLMSIVEGYVVARLY